MDTPTTIRSAWDPANHTEYIITVTPKVAAGIIVRSMSNDHVLRIIQSGAFLVFHRVTILEGRPTTGAGKLINYVLRFVL